MKSSQSKIIYKVFKVNKKFDFFIPTLTPLSPKGEIPGTQQGGPSPLGELEGCRVGNDFLNTFLKKQMYLPDIKQSRE